MLNKPSLTLALTVLAAATLSACAGLAPAAVPTAVRS
jgi:hypothetical protein